MKKLFQMLAIFCCFSLIVACGEDDNGDNGDNGDDDGAMACLQTCDDDADCGEEDAWDCADGFCEPDQCEDDGDCEAESRGWFEGCEETAECNDGQLCIEFDGQGLCATEEDAMDCEDMDMVAYDEETYEDGDDVTVCGMDEDYECIESLCLDPEMVDDDGEDQCEEDADCDDIDNADTCYDGVCGCSDDEVCADDFACTDV